MRIVVAGIYRSGSTFLYNVIRETLKEVDADYIAGFEDSGSWHDHNRKHEVIKSHKFYKSLARTADKVFTSWRNIEDIKASMDRINDLEGYHNAASSEDLDRYIRWLLKWQHYSHYLMDYSKLEIGRHKDIIQDCIKILGIKDPPEANTIYENVMSLRPPEEGRDPTTLLHADHFSS